MAEDVRPYGAPPVVYTDLDAANARIRELEAALEMSAMYLAKAAISNPWPAITVHPRAALDRVRAVLRQGDDNES